MLKKQGPTAGKPDSLFTPTPQVQKLKTGVKIKIWLFYVQGKTEFLLLHFLSKQLLCVGLLEHQCTSHHNISKETVQE